MRCSGSRFCKIIVIVFSSTPCQTMNLRYLRMAAGYMALTLLVESGWLGTLWSAARLGIARCWGGLRGRHRRHGGALYERMGDDVDAEGSLLPGLALMEDEDVRAERLALQAGACSSQSPFCKRCQCRCCMGSHDAAAAFCKRVTPAGIALQATPTGDCHTWHALTVPI